MSCCLGREESSADLLGLMGPRSHSENMNGVTSRDSASCTSLKEPSYDSPNQSCLHQFAKLFFEGG